jgi:glutamate decarboxylase
VAWKAGSFVIENSSKNMPDVGEYPVVMAIHLWGVQKGEKAIASATTGSSEAIYLGGLCNEAALAGEA